MQNLSERFIDAEGGPIVHEGQLIHPIFERAVVDGATLRIHRLGCRQEPTQGLEISLTTGFFHINGQRLKKARLWADTSPDAADISFDIKRGVQSTFKTWNIWRGEPERADAWIGNCGMMIEEHSASSTLRCSCGVGDANFEDLVVLLEF